MAKKTYEPKTPKELKDAIRASKPTPVEPTVTKGVNSPDDTFYIEWEQSNDTVTSTGYMKVVDGNVNYTAPVNGMVDKSFSGILRDIDNNVTRVSWANNKISTNFTSNAEFVEGEYQFFNIKYKIT